MRESCTPGTRASTSATPTGPARSISAWSMMVMSAVTCARDCCRREAVTTMGDSAWSCACNKGEMVEAAIAVVAIAKRADVPTAPCFKKVWRDIKILSCTHSVPACASQNHRGSCAGRLPRTNFWPVSRLMHRLSKPSQSTRLQWLWNDRLVLRPVHTLLRGQYMQGKAL